MTELSFPRQQARTRRFTLGAPRNFTVSPDGERVVFLRSRGGTDPVACVWMLDVQSGKEELLVDPQNAVAGADDDLPPEERARRERAREQSGGVVRYTTDREVRRIAFDLSGHLCWFDIGDGVVHTVEAPGAAVDARLSPTGEHLGFVAGGALHVAKIGAEGNDDPVPLAAPEEPGITYGLAEFVAAEEMDREEGYWWAPEGDRLLVARVDERPVQHWHISDPSRPEASPVEVAYPRAGTTNADVRLFVVGLSGDRVEVEWERDRFEYVAKADWSRHGLLVVVQSRDQRILRVLTVDPATGRTSVKEEQTDEHWVDLVNGLPRFGGDGAYISSTDDGDTRRLLVDGVAVTPIGMQLRGVLAVDGPTVVFTACTEPTEIDVWTWSQEPGLAPVVAPDSERAEGRSGSATATRAGGVTVLTSSGLGRTGSKTHVITGDRVVTEVASLAEIPVLKPNLKLLRASSLELRTAVLFPTGHEPGSRRLPVLMDPYGGPGFQRVIASDQMFLASQWFADQGFAVIVGDGRGTPGRGPAFERAVRGDLAGPVLEDQVAILHGAADQIGDLDLSKVAIRGWSFGGFLAALAVMRRPDVFHAAVAGAPPTDWHLYDTHYTERYLGHPDDEPENYDRSWLLGDADKLERPLLLVHGLADDNVVVAHTLQLSARLLAAGKPHQVLPLSGVTHMASQEDVAENLLLLQLQFLRTALGI